ncbi:MAG: hypothetical protein O2971_03245 [Proteobacteria bacterium]|nr:hypothetical protein [Pseudomonadota bacterium]
MIDSAHCHSLPRCDIAIVVINFDFNASKITIYGELALPGNRNKTLQPAGIELG